ncbi:hypothetical protein VTN00DRAFT_7563 [Thermoascus crustaceus]|uniref:uncharacterized protein n=1 Tax=Thermoascus crustaceus TaxID=5088 RepID=UPI00374343B5
MAEPTVSGRAKGSGPSLLACLSCRQKHLKCDGKTPVCGRCASSGLECQYTPSRRGYKGPSKKRRANPASPEQTAADVAAAAGLEGHGMDIPPDWNLQGGFGYPLLSSGSSSPANNIPAASQPGRQPTIVTSPLTPDSSSSIGGDGYLVDLYYSYFHPSHPVLPPLRLFYRFCPPPYLEHVLKFIGAHFTPAVSSEVYRPTAVSSVVDQEPSVEKVQALTLLAVVLHSRNERPEAGECLARAVDLAFELGLNRKNFAETMGEGDPIREECLRRTWWELFVVEGMLTALGVSQAFKTSMVPLEVPLPCEERIYQDGLNPPTPPTISQFDDRVFADEEMDFSSFSHRIEAVRILGRVVALQDTREGQQDMVEAIDARIASWFHHLPESKSEPMRPDGSVDEMMFQATMIINGASIYLHFPRSDLLSSPAVAAEVICGHQGPYMTPAFSHHVHAMKAVKAASEISNLASMRQPMTKHTPFFICALVLSSIVQLAAYSVKAGHMPDPRRDRLTLTIGVFKSLGRTWAISQSIMRQMKAVARDVLDIGVRPTQDHSELDFTAFLEGSQFWLSDSSGS